MRLRLACIPPPTGAAARGGACWSSGNRNRPPSTQPPVGMVTTGSGREAPLPARWPIVTETVWFTRSFSPFSDAGEPPPFDHHGGYPFDKAMWAPWEVAAL